MDNPPAGTPRFRDRRVTPASFAPCYALLAAAFTPDVLESAAVMQADLAALAGEGQPVQDFMLARYISAGNPPSPQDGGRGEGIGVPAREPEAEEVISLISGCYLALPGESFHGQGIGFIEYLATRPAYQRQGHASAMLVRFEQEMARAAAARGEQLRLVLGEIDADMLAYKMSRGYHNPAGSRYAQPPISFDSASGEPLFPAIPKLLMAKSWGGAVTTSLLLYAVETIFAKRYLPRTANEGAIRNAAAYIREYLFEPFAKSLKTEGENVVWGK